MIGNVDRHHENWGLLWQITDADGGAHDGKHLIESYAVAPSYDHASSLGHELLDEKRAEKLRNNSVESYVRKGRGGIYIAGGTHGENPLGLVEAATPKYPEYFRPVLDLLRGISLDLFLSIVDRIPASRISEPGKEFAKAMLKIAYAALVRIE